MAIKIKTSKKDFGRNTSFISQSFNIVKELSKSLELTYIRVCVIAIFIGILELINVAVIFPALNLLAEPDNKNLGSLTKGLVDYFGITIIVCFIPVIIFIQAIISILNEQFFVKKIADWRVNQSISFLKSLWNLKFKSSHLVKSGEIEAVLLRNIGISVKMRHYLALLFIECILALIFICIAIYITIYSIFLFIVALIIYLLINKLTLHRRIRNTETAKKQYDRVAHYSNQIYSDRRTLLTYDFSLSSNHFSETLGSASYAILDTDKINILVKLINQPILISLIFSMSAGLFYFASFSIVDLLTLGFVFYRTAPKVISVVQLYADLRGDLPVDISESLRSLNLEDEKGLQTKKRVKNFKRLNIKDGFYKISKDYSIQNINVDIRFGELIVIRGKSGVGKSSILDILAGFSDLTKGNYSVNQSNFSKINGRYFQQNCLALVRTESKLFNGTISENITFGKSKVDKNKLRNLCESLGIDKIWSKTEQEYTQVKEFGNNFSAGERQRMLIARAVFKDPKLLLLDEPTSNLDAESEKIIIDFIASLKRKTTIVVVSHNGLIDSQADKIYEIYKGIFSKKY